MAVSAKLLAGLLTLYLFLAVSGHFYSLAKLFPRPPVKYTLADDYIQLTASDGVKLIARHWPNPSAKYTMLYLHGNYEDLGSIGEYIPQFVSAGYAVFAIDYRNYGFSGGTPNESNTCDDVRLAYDYMRDQLHIPAGHIIVFGYSLGSGPAVELLLHRPATGLVLQGAYVSAYRVMTGVPLFPGDKFVNIAKVPRLTLPVYVIHGTADATVPFWHGEALYAAITARKGKLFVEGGGHTRLAEYTGPLYWEKLKEFTDSL
ncbi:MAG TPA: alpha/beta hydrolase [Lacunisphaera sp.]